MPNPKTPNGRTPAQKDADRQMVARLSLEGLSTHKIAEKMNVSQRTVCRDLDVIRREWRERSVEMLDEVKARELAKLDRIEAEAWEAYWRTTTNKEKRVVERRPGPKGGDYTKIETEGQAGDPRFLKIILDCQERRAKILGTDAPTKVAATSPDGAEERPFAMIALPAQLSPEEWAATFAPKPAE